MITSRNIYNEFAKDFRQHSQKREKYISKIDTLILNCIKVLPQPIRIIDIGAGDGIRGYLLAKKVKAKELYLVDNSEEMIDLCKGIPSAKILLADISKSRELSRLKYKFNVILCLWNVFGHIDTKEARLQALSNIYNLLSKDGIFFLDVSNRYNLSSYGYVRVMRNVLKDVFLPFSQSKGDIFCDIDISKDKSIKSFCHYHSPLEIVKLVKKAGFKIEKKLYINYQTGKVEKNPFKGQILLILKK